MKKSFLFLVIGLLFLFLQSCSDDDNPVEIIENQLSNLVVNEICPKNATTIKDSTGNAGDWVEIYNNGNEAVDLKDAIIKYSYFEDAVELEFEYVIPQEFVIPAKGYDIIWCDAKNEGLHTNFDLKTKKGGKISILDKDKNLIDSYTYTDTEVTLGVEDVSIARMVNGETVSWKMFGPGYDWWPTPKEANTEEIPIPEIQTAFINEIMVKNETTIQDGNGNFSDWIEIYNEGDSELNLKGYKIRYEYEGGTPVEYEFTSGLKIPAKSFQLIWCDGSGENEYTSFDLKAQKGGTITLIKPDGNTADFKEYNDTDLVNGTADISYGRKKDGGGSWVMFGTGYDDPVTPGQTNG